MSSKKKLHIVSFDNPFPPNYGGVIDVFYKLRALHDIGVEITLHAFEYGRKPAKQLNQFCKKVHYYQRRNFVNPFVGPLPYIVNTRNSPELLDNLGADDAPILFEGLHTCFFLDHPALAKRKKYVRMHNIEHEYYEKLEQVERNFFKKYFFSKEAARLKEFEAILHQAQGILAISENDKQTLGALYSNVYYIPAFHSNDQVDSIEGKGRYAFYHGKLSVGENDEAARFLVEHVFNQTDLPLYIAGDRPSALLKSMVSRNENITLFENLSTGQISELIQQAHVNVIPTFQSTGIKLKLINVLYQGRFVLANDMMVKNTGLENLCEQAQTPEEFKTQLKRLQTRAFTTADIEQRRLCLNGLFDNARNANAIVDLLFEQVGSEIRR
jgi:hypothetical protein